MSCQRLSYKEEAISSAREILESCGYLVESPKILKGRSGVSHKFDILAKGENGSIVVEFLEPHLADEIAVIALYAKIIDIRDILNPSKILLVAPSKMSQAGKTLAQQYTITVVEAKDKESLTEEFKTHLAAPQSS
jgi:hypothetical protein